jgi:hypothetical protein
MYSIAFVFWVAFHGMEVGDKEGKGISNQHRQYFYT